MRIVKWAQIPRAPVGWLVSDDGQVRNHRGIKTQSMKRTGYMIVSVAGLTRNVHRVVADAFLPKLHSSKNEINHKNGNKVDNRVTNLEWCTRSENMKHAYDSGLHPGVSRYGSDNPNSRRRGAANHQSMPVIGLFPDGRSVSYESQKLAAADGFCPCKISLCISGVRRTHAGAIWSKAPTGEAQ